MLFHNPEKITGNILFRVFDQLKKDRTILRLNLIGKEYEGLTLITGIKSSNGSPRLLIDYPSDDGHILRNSKGSKVFFEYSGRDKLQYRFRSTISGIEENDIYLEFPREIRRLQRRKNFRIAPPMGTTIELFIDGNGYECSVINISQGGALIGQDSGHRHNKVFFYPGADLKGINLVCKAEYAKVRIRIEKAEIKRIDKNHATGRYNYALQFKHIKKDSEDQLRQFIYDCQREVLKRRSFLSES